MENKPEFYLENGLFVCRLYVGLDDERKAILQEHIDAVNTAAKTKAKLESYLKVANFSCLPSGKELVSFKIETNNLIATYKFNGNYYVEKKQEPIPFTPLTPPNPDQVYINLGNRYDFKQILGSGVLTKNEKRKCLGLPEIKGEGNE